MFGTSVPNEGYGQLNPGSASTSVIEKSIAAEFGFPVLSLHNRSASA